MFFRDEYSFLSNFYPSEVVFDGEVYPTVEHAFVAAKTLNLVLRFEVKGCPTPGQAKRLGRTFNLRPDWEKIKVGVMKDLLLQKFSREPFRKLILSTGDELIVEHNTWHDNFWGECVCEDCLPKIKKNTLGKLLMEVRDLISKI